MKKITRFYAVFQNYGHDLTQKSIWFDSPQKAIDYMTDEDLPIRRYIILEKTGEYGLR